MIFQDDIHLSMIKPVRCFIVNLDKNISHISFGCFHRINRESVRA